MVGKEENYGARDYKCTFIDFKRRPEGPVRATDRQRSLNRSISKRSSMLRNAIVVLAIVLVLGSSGLSTSAFARSGGFGRGGGGGGFCGNNFCGGLCDNTPDPSFGYATPPPTFLPAVPRAP